jgi:signal transduction histidine kinase
MGKLFWKFFFIFWLAQFVTAFGVGAAIWFDHPGNRLGSRIFEGGVPPPPSFGVDAPERRQSNPYPERPPPHHPAMPLFPIAAGGLVSLLFAALLAWYFAKPIRSLRMAFESISSGDLETRIGTSMGHRRDELADLGSDFDRMAFQLQNLIEAQHRLLHDVSHELRSPLARLQAAADLMHQQPDRAVEFVKRIECDTARMDRLIGELLTLARLDSGMTGTLEEVVDVHDIAADVVEDARLESEAKKCTLDIEVSGPIAVCGKRDLLYRALENIVRNAVRHSPVGGRIAIAAHSADGSWYVSVEDCGPGVPECDLAAIFEPFFRSGVSHSLAGYGLGLAIARRVVELHSGTIAAVNRPLGGLTVTLRLPMADSCK